MPRNVLLFSPPSLPPFPVAQEKALGQRNRVESERELRKIRKKELESLMKDKKDLLDRQILQVFFVHARALGCTCDTTRQREKSGSWRAQVRERRSGEIEGGKARLLWACRHNPAGFIYGL